MGTKEAKYISYINSKYPQLKIDKIDCNFNDGKHADIVIVNEKEVFKFSKFDWSAGYIENEVNVLELMGKSLYVQVPKAEKIETGVAKLSYIKGEPLFRNYLMQQGSRIYDMFAEQTAMFLKQLHSTSLKGEVSKKIHECQACMSSEDWLDKFEEIERKVFPYCDSYSKEYCRLVFRPLMADEHFTDYQPVLIHGDFMPYHILVNKDTNRLSGIIDFGMSGIGDPAYDIGLLLDNYGEAFVRRMGRYYKNIMIYMDRARFYAQVNQLLWAKSLSDMLTTRDFSNLRIHTKDPEIMPIGTKWVEVRT